jgi:hypothetical protein
MRQFIPQGASFSGNRTMVEVVVLQQESGQPAAYQRVHSTAATRNVANEELDLLER